MKIAFWGNFGTQNFGNECTLAAILLNFRQRMPQADLVVIAVAPEDVRARHQVEAIPMWNEPPDSYEPWGPLRILRVIRRGFGQIGEWRRAFRQSRGLDALIIPGTGVLNDHNEGMFGLPYHLFKWALATRLLGGKVIFVSVGAERISRPLSRFFIRSALRMAERRSFRDPHALAQVRSIGFTGASDVFPDLAFSLPKPASAEMVLRRSRPAIALGLYDYKHRGRDGATEKAAYERYLERICTLILWLSEHEYSVRVIIGDMSYDMDVRADVRSQLQRRGFDLTRDSYADEPAESYELIMNQLNTVDLVVASRFHNILLALYLGKPVVSLSYEAKIEALMLDMGLQEFCQTLEEFDLEKVIEQISQLETRAASVHAMIADRARINREKLERQYALIMTSLGVSPLARSG